MLSVVIVTYESEACIGTCLDALAKCLPDAQPIVVDNASRDRSSAIAQERGATVVRQKRNIGFGRACNIGAHQATLEHLLFVNPDVAILALDRDALAKALAVDEVGQLVPATPANDFLFEESRWIAEALSRALGGLRPRELPRRSRRHTRGRALWASAAMLLVRRSEFLSLGGFDSRFFLYYEDRDLSWRYRTAGFPVRTTGALKADHLGGGSSELDNLRADILAFAMLGWLQYVHTVQGSDAARRAWALARRLHSSTAFAARTAARLVPWSPRVRRKSLQLDEIRQALELLAATSGVIDQSDDHPYWPEAISLLNHVSR